MKTIMFRLYLIYMVFLSFVFLKLCPTFIKWYHEIKYNKFSKFRYINVIISPIV